MYRFKAYLIIIFLFNIKILAHDHFVEVDQLEAFSYILRLKFPKHIKQIPQIKGYYKGKQLNFDKDFCILSESKVVSKFFLFITKAENAPTIKSNGNNILYFSRQKNKPFKLFSITLENKLWIVKEEKDISHKIPESSIIILLDPDFVESIKEENHLNVKMESTYLIYLPKIIINTKVKQIDLDRDSELALLSACDLNAFHSNIQTHKKHQGIVSISLRTL